MVHIDYREAKSDKYDRRYTYEPFSQSQNDNPESELPLLSGDYVLVWGEIGEDGYLEAELMDGRRGLVPSNYITKLVGEDLMEFHQSMVVGTSGGGAGEVADDGWSTSIPQVSQVFSPHQVTDSEAADVSGPLYSCH